jgi:hypothetical protein
MEDNKHIICMCSMFMSSRWRTVFSMCFHFFGDFPPRSIGARYDRLGPTKGPSLRSLSVGEVRGENRAMMQ